MRAPTTCLVPGLFQFWREKIGCSDLNSWGVAVHVCNVCVVVIVVVGDGMDDLSLILDVVMIMAPHLTNHDNLAS